MTVKELREKLKGVPGIWRMKKEDLEKEYKKLEHNFLDSDVEVFTYESDEEWHEIRKKGIGGSDIGAILGVNKYKCQADVYNDKKFGSDFKGNKFTHWGHTLEPVIRNEFAKIHKEFEVMEFNKTMKKGVFTANVDGIIFNEDGELGILEIKTANAFAGKAWGDEVPHAYYAQTLHYMYVTGAKFAYIAVLIGGSEYKEYKVERDEASIDFMVAKGENFWYNYYLKDIIPPADGTDAYSKYQAELLEKSENEIILDIESEGTLDLEYNELKSKEKESDKRMKFIKQKMIDEIIKTGAKKGNYGEVKFNVIVSRGKKQVRFA